MYKKVKYAIDKGNHKTYRWNTVGNCPGEKNSGEHLEGCKHHIGPHQPQSTVKNLSQVQRSTAINLFTLCLYYVQSYMYVEKVPGIQQFNI